MFVLASSFMTPRVLPAPPTALPPVVAPGPSPDGVGHTAIPEGPPVVSPDPAPPHPLRPRVVLEAPGAGLARILAALANGALRDHGR